LSYLEKRQVSLTISNEIVKIIDKHVKAIPL